MFKSGTRNFCLTQNYDRLFLYPIQFTLLLRACICLHTHIFAAIIRNFNHFSRQSTKLKCYVTEIIIITSIPVSLMKPICSLHVVNPFHACYVPSTNAHLKKSSRWTLATDIKWQNEVEITVLFVVHAWNRYTLVSAPWQYNVRTYWVHCYDNGCFHGILCVCVCGCLIAFTSMYLSTEFENKQQIHNDYYYYCIQYMNSFRWKINLGHYVCDMEYAVFEFPLDTTLPYNRRNKCIHINYAV